MRTKPERAAGQRDGHRHRDECQAARQMVHRTILRAKPRADCWTVCPDVFGDFVFGAPAVDQRTRFGSSAAS